MILIELALPAMSEDFRRAAELILRGELSRRFWVVVVVLGTILPLVLLALGITARAPALIAVAAILGLFGLWVFENIFIKAGQAVPLS